MPLDERVGLVKQILENLRHPEQLDDHPWAEKLIVQSALGSDLSPGSKHRGTVLASAVVGLFKELMPASPPKKGKRLDTRWGEFGILAAHYFGPAEFGIREPSSLREAWGEIDHAILLFVYGKRAEECSAEEVARYKLIGGESGVAPYSTISDWHLNGIKRLADRIDERERHLSRAAESSIYFEKNSSNDLASITITPLRKNNNNWIYWLILASLLIAGAVAVNKAWKVYQLASEVSADLNNVQSLIAKKLDLQTVVGAKMLLQKIQTDMDGLRKETEPILRVTGGWLAWLPVYGSDFEVSADLLVMTDELVNATSISYEALTPVLEAATDNSSSFSPAQLSLLLVEAQPRLLEAQKKLELAMSIRRGIDVERLSPRARELLMKVDPLPGLLQDGLTASIAAPALLGASDDGPKTYMLLAQNEDELRATGGLITLVGSFVFDNGQVLGLEFQDSALFQDWSKPYPSAPWQMQAFMNIPVMLLRDANWFPDYPTSVARIEYLYAYHYKHSVDGVIALDQQSIVFLLDALGPVTMDGIPEPITADNVIQFMRQSKTPPPGADLKTWDRKAIISKLASTLLERLISGKNVDWQKIAFALQKALDQKHILLQMDLKEMKDLLARRGWDGTVRAGTGDFLMAVDSNVGYDKTNAVLKEKLSYDVDLSDLKNPKSSLAVFHQNQASPDAICTPTVPDAASPEYWYLTDRCYHNYLRIYVPAGTGLMNATPHFITAEWMPLGQAIPARVDTLNEKIVGLQAYGTLLVVPGGKTLSTSFQFSLAPGVVTGRESTKTYTLKIQKQPGTLAIPITVRIHLPDTAKITSLSKEANANGKDILIETTLETDLIVEVVFSLQ